MLFSLFLQKKYSVLIGGNKDMKKMFFLLSLTITRKA